MIDRGLPEHEAITTCALTVVAERFKAEMKGAEVAPDYAVEGRQGERRPRLCVKGRFAGLCDPCRPDHAADDPQEDQRSVEVGHRDEAIDYAAGEFKRIQGEMVATRSAGSRRRDRHQRGDRPGPEAAGGLRQQQCRYLRPLLPPTGYGLGQTYGTSAGTQTFGVALMITATTVVGANPTDAHPVFASRINKPLREGAS